MMNSKNDIRALLTAFQDGYRLRDTSRLEAFMDLFTPDAEVIGTGGVKPGDPEWHMNRDSTQVLVSWDWESWGDLRLDIESAAIHTRGDAGWVAAPASVSMDIGSWGYERFLEDIRDYIETSQEPADQVLHYILRSGSNTLYELERGEQFTWPLRFTAVVIRDDNRWKFAQVHFSFPTIYYPDVRISDSAGE